MDLFRIMFWFVGFNSGFIFVRIVVFFVLNMVCSGDNFWGRVNWWLFSILVLLGLSGSRLL